MFIFPQEKLEKKDIEKEPLLTAETYLFNRTLYVTHPEAKTLWTPHNLIPS